MKFAGKTTLITGAAGNLGKAAAAAFRREGASLVLFDINQKLLRAAYPEAGPEQLLIDVDLLDPSSVGQAVRQALQVHPTIDIVCNIAGGFRMGPAVHETPPEMWHLMLGLNAGTVLNVARAVVPAMLATGHGKIINIAAAAGLGGRANMGAYGASKSAVIRLTESMAAELREKGINVNCVLPTIIDTPQNRADMPGADPSRWVAPEALADVMLFLASDAARAVHGAAIQVSGLS